MTNVARPAWAGALSRNLTRAVLLRDGGICHWCGGVATSFDHWPVARSEGGADSLDNGVASCLPCNQARGAAMMRERRRRVGPSRDW